MIGEAARLAIGEPDNDQGSPLRQGFWLAVALVPLARALASLF